MKENTFSQDSQKDLWDAQHKRRRSEHKDIAGTPNEFAKKCIGYIPDGGKVLELGAASGRDSRFFVRERNCEIYALDFSEVALKHLQEDAEADGSIDFVQPISADIKHLPLGGENVLDAVYARSSLHISDLDLEELLTRITTMLKPGGYIMVEGKNFLDPKIKESRIVADNLVLDDEGHLRRI